MQKVSNNELNSHNTNTVYSTRCPQYQITDHVFFPKPNAISLNEHSPDEMNGLRDMLLPWPSPS